MLRLSPDAEKDLDDAANWYDEQASGLGDRFLTEARSTLERIEARPLLHPIATGAARRALLRRFPYGISYEPDDQGWIVLAILHQRRSADLLRKRMETWWDWPSSSQERGRCPRAPARVSTLDRIVWCGVAGGDRHKATLGPTGMHCRPQQDLEPPRIFPVDSLPERQLDSLRSAIILQIGGFIRATRDRSCRSSAARKWPIFRPIPKKLSSRSKRSREVAIMMSLALSTNMTHLSR